MATIKLSVQERGRAVGYLKKGLPVSEATQKLKENFHPEYSLEEITRAYFPKRGRYSLLRFIGKGKSEIVTGYLDFLKKHEDLPLRKLAKKSQQKKTKSEVLKDVLDDKALAQREEHFQKLWQKLQTLAEFHGHITEGRITPSGATPQYLLELLRHTEMQPLKQWLLNEFKRKKIKETDTVDYDDWNALFGRATKIFDKPAVSQARLVLSGHQDFLNSKLLTIKALREIMLFVPDSKINGFTQKYNQITQTLHNFARIANTPPENEEH